MYLVAWYIGVGVRSSSRLKISAVRISEVAFDLRARADAGDLVILLLPGLGLSGVEGADVPPPASLADSFFSL